MLGELICSIVNIIMNTNRAWYSKGKDIKTSDNIHQILMFGTIDEIKALEHTLGKDRIKEAFLQHPKKIYTAPALNFIKKSVLKITALIDEQKYLKYTLRRTG